MRGVTQVLCAAALLGMAPAWSQAKYPGDDALALAGEEWNSATQVLAARRLQAILKQLQVSPDRAARHGDFARMKFLKAEKFLEIGELSDAVLIARRGAKITEARNLAVIADGDVEISFASAVLIVASGSIRIAHEMPTATNSGGIYVTRASLSMGHARDPLVYAAGGAQMSHSAAVTAYNTQFQDSLVEISTALPARLFRDERASKPQPSILGLGDQSIRFEGRRCRAGLRIELLEHDLQASLRAGAVPCGHIDSASVRCEGDAGVTAAGISVERWTFQACGRRLEVVSRSNPLTRSVVLQTGGGNVFAPPQRLTSKHLTSEEQQAITRIFSDALAHLMKGEIVPARAKYAEALNIAPDHAPALSNIASLDRRIAQADAAAAPFTALIDAGKGDARTYADRGLAFFRASDLGRGLADLDFAAASAPSDSTILLERADTYMRADRPGECARTASESLARLPRDARVHELRAWCNLMLNEGEAAFRDARASLGDHGPWTREAFARQKAGYRVIAGYFALRQTAGRDRSREWLREWRAQMAPRTWPDAFAQYLLGELDYDDMRKVAAALQAEDRGNALGEATAFVALETHFHSGSDATSRSNMTKFFREGYAANRTLALALYHSLVTPARLIKRREDLPAAPAQGKVTR